MRARHSQYHVHSRGFAFSTSRTNFVTGLSEMTQATAAVNDFLFILSPPALKVVGNTGKARLGGGWGGRARFLPVAFSLLLCKLYRNVTRQASDIG